MVISEIRPQALILLQKSTSTFCRRMTSMGMVYIKSATDLRLLSNHLPLHYIMSQRCPAYVVSVDSYYTALMVYSSVNCESL
ncbi:hypothetical protein LENED_008301 [Lentinula edodes]|uniref:Uncharacterized protein n=1 Tax=Lentinula edodes TaxID=5353 RepID=A0A1Q3EGU4_LENED|nr:hypothetical protein LENED_008301 [Lentinula edodes]